jgi:hypothetical protein
MTITLTREEAQSVLDALEQLDGWDTATQGDIVFDPSDEIEILRARLAQPEPEPVEQDGSWVSVHKSCVQDCWCHKCNEHTVVKVGGYDIPYKATTMILCPDCGNKRCPKANDHDNACTGSNELGQPGSAYADTAPPQREWQGLTAAEMMELLPKNNDVLEKRIAEFACAIEAKLKEKNASHL